MKYKVINKEKTTQRIYINGQVVYIEPGKFIITDKPPVENHVFRIEKAEQIEELKPKKSKRRL
jgi:hypothetical protein